jgi:hypothetical protein
LFGKLTREELSSWAYKITENDNIKVSDHHLKEIIDFLVLCDAIQIDGTYVYGEKEDLMIWKNKLQ